MAVKYLLLAVAIFQVASAQMNPSTPQGLPDFFSGLQQMWQPYMTMWGNLAQGWPQPPNTNLFSGMTTPGSSGNGLSSFLSQLPNGNMLGGMTNPGLPTNGMSNFWPNQGTAQPVRPVPSPSTPSAPLAGSNGFPQQNFQIPSTTGRNNN